MQNYRYYILWRCPQIRFLDFQKVKDAERSKGKELFGTFDAPTELAQSIMAVRSKNPMAFGTSASTVNGTNKNKRVKMTDKEKKKLETLIKKAKTLTEVQRLEKALAEGRMAPGVMDDDAMDRMLACSLLPAEVAISGPHCRSAGP